MLQQIWWIGLNQKYYIGMRISYILLKYNKLQQDSKIKTYCRKDTICKNPQNSQLVTFSTEN